MNTDNLVKCPCQHCNSNIEFEPAQMDFRGASAGGALGPMVTCPHCGMDTIIFVPRNVAMVEPQPAPQAIASTPSDECFLNERGIAVTKTRFMVASQLFAMANISSVRLEKVSPSQGIPVTMIIFGAILTLTGILNEVLGAGVFGMAILLIGIYWLCKRKTMHRVILFAAGGEITGYESQDQIFIMRVVEALNSAIIARG